MRFFGPAQFFSILLSLSLSYPLEAADTYGAVCSADPSFALIFVGTLTDLTATGAPPQWSLGKFHVTELLQGGRGCGQHPGAKRPMPGLGNNSRYRTNLFGIDSCPDDRLRISTRTLRTDTACRTSGCRTRIPKAFTKGQYSHGNFWGSRGRDAWISLEENPVA